MATMRPLFEVHATFFMGNEIFSEDIRKIQNVLLFVFLFYIAIALISGVTRALSQDGRLS